MPEAVPVTKTILLTGYRAKIIRLRPTDVIIDRAGETVRKYLRISHVLSLPKVCIKTKVLFFLKKQSKMLCGAGITKRKIMLYSGYY